MSVLDDLRALAAALPQSVKPVAAEVTDVLAAVVHTLEAAGVKVPAGVETAVTDVAAAAEPDEPPTEGGAVFDVAGTGEAAAADSAAAPAPPDVAALEEELRAAMDHAQSLQVQLADAQKTQHSAEQV